MSDIKIRIGNENDIDALVDFNISMARETEGKDLKREVLRPGVAGLFQNKQYGFYVVAEDVSNNITVGGLLVTYEWSDWRNATFWWIQSVYVIPECRRQGVYRTMHEAIRREARATFRRP